MLKKSHMLYIVLGLALIWASSVFAQGAPEPINDAMADLSSRVGRTLTIGDLDNWLWSQAGYSAPCPEATPVSVTGYQFLLTYGGQVYDYRVTADRAALFLCSITPVESEAVPTPAPIDSDEPPYSNPLCPTPPQGLTYMRTRLTPDVQARVSAGLPNRLRDNPGTDAAVIGEIPPGSVFTVLAGPNCDAEGRLWWQIDYDGLVGWTAEVSGGDHLLEPFPGAVLQVERGFITAETAEFVQEVSRLQGNFGARLVFTPTTEEQPEFSLVVLGALGSEAAFIYDVNALDQPPRMLDAPNLLTQVTFARRGNPNLGFFGDADGGIRLWDITPGARLLERAFLLGHNTAVSALAVDFVGERIASTGGLAFLTEQRDDNQYAIVIWDVNTVSQAAALRGHTASVTSIAFGAPGTLASAGLDGTVRLWNLDNGQSEVLFETPFAINDLIYHSNLSRVAVALADGSITLFDAATGELPDTFSAHAAPVTALAENGGGLLVSAAEDGTVYLWDIADPDSPLASLDGHTAAVTDVAFSPDGTLIATLSEDNTVRIWAVAQNVG